MITRVIVSLTVVATVAFGFPHVKIPDCKEVPEGSHFPDPTDCAKYWTCTNDGPVLNECPDGLLFNFELEACDFDYNVDCDLVSTPDYSTNGDGDLTTDWITNESTTTATTASDWTTDRTTTTTPEWSTEKTTTTMTPEWSVASTTEGNELTTQEGEAPDCQDVPEGTHFPDPYDCARYWTCTNDGPILNICPDGLYFNITLEACDFEYNVDCSHVSSTVDGDVSTTTMVYSTTTPWLTTDTITTAPSDLSTTDGNFGWSTTTTVRDSTISEGSEESTPFYEEPDCSDVPVDSMIPDLHDCHVYWVCAQGGAIRLECPDQLEFNPEIQQCDFPENFECDLS